MDKHGNMGKTTFCPYITTIIFSLTQISASRQYTANGANLSSHLAEDCKQKALNAQRFTCNTELFLFPLRNTQTNRANRSLILQKPVTERLIVPHES